MKKLISFGCFSIFYILLAGCAAFQPTYYGTYNISLQQADRPAVADAKYGNVNISPLTENGRNKYVFEDEMVGITWDAEADDLSALFVNKTSSPIKIIWDDAAYIDENGVSHRIIHSGIKYSEKDKPQLPTKIAPNGKIEDAIIPTNLVYFEEGYYGENDFKAGRWIEKPLFEYCRIGGNEDSAIRLLQSNVDKTFQILLPLNIEKIVYDYVFTFRVKDYIYKGRY